MAQTARDLMQREVITVGPGTPLLEVHRLFLEEEITGAPVVEDDGRVVGVVSSSDLLRAVEEEYEAPRSDPTYFREIQTFSGPDWTQHWPADFQDRLAERTAADVMTAEVLFVAPDATIAEVARELRRHRVHRVLVAEEGRLVGIISTFDLVALLEK